MSSASSGPWDLPLGGFEVVLRVTFVYPIDIVAHRDGGVDGMNRFEGAFRSIESNQRGAIWVLRRTRGRTSSWFWRFALIGCRP